MARTLLLSAAVALSIGVLSPSPDALASPRAARRAAHVGCAAKNGSHRRNASRKNHHKAEGVACAVKHRTPARKPKTAGSRPVSPTAPALTASTFTGVLAPVEFTAPESPTPVDGDSPEATPSESPSSEISPSETETTPSETNLSESPPEETGPSEQPPVEPPRTETPPVEAPTTETSLTETTPAETPTETTPAEPTPEETPTEPAPAESPSSETSPPVTETTPSEPNLSESPPGETGPSEQPPVEPPRTETPPVEAPLTETTPAEPAPEETPTEPPPAEPAPTEPAPAEPPPVEPAPTETPEEAPPTKTTPEEASTQTTPVETTSKSVAPFRFFSSSSFWNEQVSAGGALDPGSSQMVSALASEIAKAVASGGGPTINTTSWSVPVYTVSSAQPTVKVALVNPSRAPALQSAWEKVPLPSNAQSAKGTDKHLVVWQPSTDHLWEFWGLEKTETGWQAHWGGAMEKASSDSGVYGPEAWAGAKTGWGASATSLSIAGGLITFEDLQMGQINHALAMAIPAPRATVYASPAQRTDGWSSAANALPEGAHLRLDPQLDLASLHLPKVTLMLAEAAQRYGLFVRDKSSTLALYAQDPTPLGGTNPYWTKAGYFEGMSAKEVLASFPWSHLQVLQMQIN